jgi:hypothetical protein
MNRIQEDLNMKNHNRLLGLAVLILAVSHAAYAQAPGPASKDPRPKPVLIAPDLIPDGVGYQGTGLYEGKIELVVSNVGKKASVKSLVRILITMPGETESTGWSRDVRALKPGESVRIPISTGKQLNLAKYCMIVDALNQNKESGEKNNERCGEFDGKP